jgi:plasmid stabilization system protein ParE
MKVVWSERAKISLSEIYEYVYQDSPKAADRVLESILDKTNSLQNEQIEYPKDPILNDQRFRFILLWSFKIIYQRTESKVIIIEIFHTRKDPGKLIF